MRVKKKKTVIILIIAFFIGGFALALYADSQDSPFGLLIAVVMMAFGIRIANLRIAYGKNKQYGDWIDSLTASESSVPEEKKEDELHI